MTIGLTKAARAALSRRGLLAGTAALAGMAALPPGVARAQGAAYPLSEFFKPTMSSGAALSPSGTRIAVAENLGTDETPRSAVDFIDAADPEGPRRRFELGPVWVRSIDWASDDRVLVTVLLRGTSSGRAIAGSNRRSEDVEYYMSRVVSVHATTGDPVVLFSDQRQRMRYTFDMGRIIDMLPGDPDNVLMAAWEADGVMGLHRVNVNTGAATRIERGGSGTYHWRAVNGVPVLRHDMNSRGTVETIMVRAPGETEWKMARRTRVREAPDFLWVGAGETPGKVLVIARLDTEDVQSVREMDLTTTALGPALNPRPGRDVAYGLPDSAGNYLGAAYYGERLEYEFVDPALAVHHRALNRFFDNACNVHFTDVDMARNRFIARVDGPAEPGAWFFYDKAARAIVNLGQARDLDPARLGASEVLQVQTRDGATIEAYLTAPPGGRPGPLVVLPHGGPEVRDTPSWDRQVQVLAAQGWWVLRPNFRGSGGYGQSFAQQGWTRWGDRMQDDVEDAVAHAIAAKGLDASKVAIMGTSYGAYAALMGAVKRPDLYKAAIGICGVYDLPDVLAWEERLDDTPGQPIYEFWTKRIGDRSVMGPALEAGSPRRRAGEIACPVLLVHGADDPVLPSIQSRRMRDALRGAGKPVELIEVEDAGHADWEDAKEQELVTRYVALLRQAFA
ncbi:prolyl oligopeptidase [Brevundimonas denitrificans]|uniref:Prolyl oligopeptidase n=1 Tax=Brevundimonas denitrificans TaxID=1443434 RepID=A0ABQ6BJL7_9CAUL|nr:alpha/beta fold hydrolase [Brevundimonas denitrificans]GLS01280.1 prolyl oligopeptidase [Brevundimonas denitrificans]